MRRALVLLTVHGLVLGATVALLGLFGIGTHPCGYVRCGNPAWVDRAIMLALWGGAAFWSPTSRSPRTS